MLLYFKGSSFCFGVLSNEVGFEFLMTHKQFGVDFFFWETIITLFIVHFQLCRSFTDSSHIALTEIKKNRFRLVLALV